jgi:RNA polymerase sigma factor (sigma-70 family)
LPIRSLGNRLSDRQTRLVPPYSILPLAPAAGRIDPDDDRLLSEAALAAQAGNRAARNALYFAFLPKLQRFTRREARRIATEVNSSVIDRDDIEQEGFLAFMRLVERWPGDQSFAAYLLGFFGWELRNTLRSFLWPETRAAWRADLMEIDELRHARPEPESDDIDFDRLIAGFTARERQLLIWRFRDDLTMIEIQHRFGMSKRSTIRLWSKLRLRLRKKLSEEAHLD